MGAAENFAKRVKAISKDIEKHARGGEHENVMKLFNAINRLEDSTNSAELRGTPENEGRWEACKSLRQAVRAAEETAYQNRTAARHADISRLNLEARQKAHQDPYGDVGYGDKYRVRKG